MSLNSYLSYENTSWLMVDSSTVGVLIAVSTETRKGKKRMIVKCGSAHSIRMHGGVYCGGKNKIWDVSGIWSFYHIPMDMLQPLALLAWCGWLLKELLNE